MLFFSQGRDDGAILKSENFEIQQQVSCFAFGHHFSVIAVSLFLNEIQFWYFSNKNLFPIYSIYNFAAYFQVNTS